MGSERTFPPSQPRHWMEVSGQLHVRPFYARGKKSDTHQVGSRAGQDAFGKRKVCCRGRKLNRDPDFLKNDPVEILRQLPSTDIVHFLPSYMYSRVSKEGYVTVLCVLCPLCIHPYNYQPMHCMVKVKFPRYKPKRLRGAPGFSRHSAL